ncbi:hypothetical protein ACFV3E_11970 [Streptomyces sp. NPDC059718]
MNKKHALALAAAAALVAAVPATMVVHRHVEAAERASLERAAQKVFQHDTDLPTADWRSPDPQAARVWDGAVSTAHIQQVEMHGDRAKVWVDESTRPYVTDPSGTTRRAGIPWVSSHLFVFEPTGDGWRLAEDLTTAERDNG